MINKSLLKTNNGMPLTQGLFLEMGYGEYSVFTLKDEDYLYKDKLYPSLKRIYLEEEDPNEYIFATKHLLGWEHWQRMCANKELAKHIDKWRYELELKLRSAAIQQIKMFATTEKGFQAAKWLADRGWDNRGAGRPSKADIERETKIKADIDSDWSDDLARIHKRM